MSKSIKIFQFRSFLFSQNLIRDMKLSQAEDVGRLREQFEEKVRELEKRYSNRYNSLRTGLILCKNKSPTLNCRFLGEHLWVVWVCTFMVFITYEQYQFQIVQTSNYTNSIPPFKAKCVRFIALTHFSWMILYLG